MLLTFQDDQLLKTELHFQDQTWTEGKGVIK